ncbi:uncharacterized protein LOC105252609 isoform X2 [Camponotus floridanus]|uniref:uncharacterized protein LOC105252609 isoform X1 n=1 Tax=Camponotus floridanus TaxID=104421 RepID=UPI00059CB9AA|nr:uncharacterized protein LOC105252609 isoform X1 [Camponotus floridanus]XP_025264450.1 uncharacterized protein LOC105252609 isoform X2 [Camponotus floridanus]
MNFMRAERRLMGGARIRSVPPCSIQHPCIDVLHADHIFIYSVKTQEHINTSFVYRSQICVMFLLERFYDVDIAASALDRCGIIETAARCSSLSFNARVSVYAKRTNLSLSSSCFDSLPCVSKMLPASHNE